MKMQQREQRKMWVADRRWSGVSLVAGLALAGCIWAASPQLVRAQTDTCFATLDASTVYSSTDAQALRDAVAAAAPGNVVRVAGFCAGVSGAQVVLITQPLTLRGGYTVSNWITSDVSLHPTTLDAQGAGRVVSATQPITLENLIIQNGRWSNSFEPGGGVSAQAEAVISNTLIRWSEATNGSGGGLYVGGSATVINSWFVSNTARYRGGGANFNTTSVISGSAFISNTTTDFNFSFGGGANFGFNGPATVINSRFEQNAAVNTAGGARFDNRATLHAVTFTHNSARGVGGAIFSNETHAEAATFSNNRATLFSGGGAEFTWVTFLTDVTFYSNTAGFDGGGGYFNLFINNPATLRRTRFISNTAGERGGGAYARSDMRLDAEDVLFTDNHAGFEGGGLFSQAQTRLAGVRFEGNHGLSGGGAFFAQAVTLTHASFVGNTANNLGGGAVLAGPATIATPITFTSNLAGFSGGGAHISSTLALDAGIFERNTAGQRGGGLAAIGPATLGAVIFRQNQALGAQGWGGGLFANGPASLSGAQLISNTARNGGGAYLFASGVLTGTVFAGNTALVNGGGALIGGAATISTSIFAANTAGAGGAPVAIQSIAATNVPLALLALNGSGGGALLLGASTLAGTDFVGNVAVEHGGGVFAWAAAQGDRVRLRNNQAGGCGGGLHAAGMTVNGRAHWINSLWAGNSAPAGAAICAAHDGGDDVLSLSHVTVVSPGLALADAARVQAGAVYLTNTLISSHTVGILRQAGLAQLSHVFIGMSSVPLSGTVVLAGPLFSGPVTFIDNADYRLAPISLAVDGGLASASTRDYFGNLRPQGGAPDIGYVESPLYLRRVFLSPIMR